MSESLFQRSRELSSISGIHKVHIYYSSSRSGLSHTGRSLPQLVVSFVQLFSAGQYELHAFGLPVLDDIAQRGNRVLRITKSLVGPDKGKLNGDDVHRTSRQLRCFAPPHDRLSPVLFRSSVILRSHSAPALLSRYDASLHPSPKPSPLLCF
jgi:hypothetical protein